MSNAWKKLQDRSKRADSIREDEQREYTRQFFYLLPLVPAVFLLSFSRESAVDVITQAPFLDSLRDLAGSVITGYAIVIAYALLIQLTEAGFYKQLSWLTRFVVAWSMWAWFYYSTWVIGDIRAAFVVAFIVGIFMTRIAGVFLYCYKTIRKGMFLGTNDRES